MPDNNELMEQLHDNRQMVFSGKAYVKPRKIRLPGGQTAQVAIAFYLAKKHLHRDVAVGAALYSDGRLVGENHIQETATRMNGHTHHDIGCLAYEQRGERVRSLREKPKRPFDPENNLGALILLKLIQAGPAEDILDGRSVSTRTLEAAKMIRDPRSQGKLFIDPALSLALDQGLGFA